MAKRGRPKGSKNRAKSAPVILRQGFYDWSPADLRAMTDYLRSLAPPPSAALPELLPQLADYVERWIDCRTPPAQKDDDAVARERWRVRRGNEAQNPSAGS